MEPTQTVFLEQPYLRTLEVAVVAVTGNGFVTDKTVFYAAGGGQPGDRGTANPVSSKRSASLKITDTRKGEAGGIIHLVDPDEDPLPAVGDRLELVLDWDRRFRHMQMHTALHVLCAAVGAPVTGGSIGEFKSRLDFDLAESPDKEALTDRLNTAIAQNYAVSTGKISDTELDANPDLVRTMSVKPPRGSGFIRMVKLAKGDDTLDYQPCGGTHVNNTSEIGRIRVSKIEKKGKMNRRIAIVPET